MTLPDSADEIVPAPDPTTPADEIVTPPARSRRRLLGFGDADSATPRRLQKLVELTLLTVVAATALVYPLRLREPWIEALVNWCRRFGTASDRVILEITPHLLGFHQPLVYKENVALVLTSVALFFYLLLKMHQLLRTQAEKSAAETTRTTTRRAMPLRTPLIVLGAFVLYAYLSSLLISPTYYYSLRTFLLMGAGLLVMVMAMDLQPTVHFGKKFMVLVLGCGLVVAIVSILQHLDIADRYFMPTFDDPRNRMGSFIGHNTALSSFLIYPMAFAAALAAIAYRRRQYLSLISLVICLALFAFVIIAAQSRAIWVLGAIAMPLLLGFVIYQQRLRVRWGAAIVIGMLLLGSVAAQTFRPDINPFARHQTLLSDRVTKDFGGKQLLAETRLRILVCSIPLVVERPVWGFGLGAFQFVYPKAQGEYFQKNPDSKLAPTLKRTDLAHNDYLQAVVELGTFGTLLGLFAIGGFIVVAARRGRSLPRGSAAGLVALSLGCPLVITALHAFVDFPFHVVSLGFLWAVGFGILVGMILRTTTASPPAPSALPPVSEPDADAIAAAPPKLRTTMVLAGAAPGVGIVLATLVITLTAKNQVADVEFGDASASLNTLALLTPDDVSARDTYLNSAREGFRRSLRMVAFNGAAYQAMAMAYLEMAQVSASRLQAARKRGDAISVDMWKASAIRELDQASINANYAELIGELRYHSNYHIIGSVYLATYRVNLEVAYLDLAIRSFEKAIAFNIGDSPSMLKLADLYDLSPRPNPIRAKQLRDTVMRINPDLVSETRLEPAIVDARRGNVVAAEETIQRVGRTFPQDWRFDAARAEVLLERMARLDFLPLPEAMLADASTTPTRENMRAQMITSGTALLAAGLQARSDDFKLLRVAAMFDVAAGRYDAAYEKLAVVLRVRPGDLDMMVLQQMLGRKLGRPARPWANFTEDPEYWWRRHMLTIKCWGEPSAGALQISRMCRTITEQGTQHGRVPTYLARLSGEILHANNQHEAAQDCLKYLQKLAPASESTQALEQAMRGAWSAPLATNSPEKR